ncbi:MAG: type I-C CRISPR-associated protein Cas5c, partial [Kiritimatiellae bacterium]|nr:type I-C CRISPR-associated protein Cas5c [Kiritimatiellia bacterium]
MRGFCLEVSGDFACFTRPEMKVERVSYDVITPSAARAIFEAILWKPAIRWQITKIEVLNPIRWASVRRNEVAGIASPRSGGIMIEDSRQQRAGLLLRDVRYRLYAEFTFIPVEKRTRGLNPSPEWLTDAEEE